MDQNNFYDGVREIRNETFDIHKFRKIYKTLKDIKPYNFIINATPIDNRPIEINELMNLLSNNLEENQG
jgi:hypothetical protein